MEGGTHNPLAPPFHFLSQTFLPLDFSRNGLLKSGARGFLAPLLGAAMLLGTIGASPKSDLFAHLYGLFAGLFVGLIVAVPQERLGRRVPAWGQAVAGGLAAALIMGSWRLALSA